MRKLLSLLALLLFASNARAQVAFDAASVRVSGGGVNDDQGTFTWNHTCSGTNRFLVVAVSNATPGGTTSISATYNGAAMTPIKQLINAMDPSQTTVFGLIAPDTGTNLVSVTVAGNDAHAGAVSFTGVDQTTPYSDLQFNQDSTGGPVQLTITSTSNSQVFASVGYNWTIAHATPDGSMTSDWRTTGTQPEVSSEGAHKTGAASVLMSWTLNTTLSWEIVAFSVDPALSMATMA